MVALFRSFLIVFSFISFALFIPHIAHAQTPLPCGEIVSGITNTPAQEDTYTFTATYLYDEAGAIRS